MNNTSMAVYPASEFNFRSHGNYIRDCDKWKDSGKGAKPDIKNYAFEKDGNFDNVGFVAVGSGFAMKAKTRQAAIRDLNKEIKSIVRN